MRVWLITTLLLACLPAVGAEPAPDLLRRVFPQAEELEPVTGPPPYWRAHRGDRTLGAVLSTAAAIGSVGYSGKPLDILVGLDTSGTITGALVLEQHEPITATGAKAADFDRLVAGLVGRSIREPVSVVRAGAGPGQIDAVAGATVSSSVIVDAVMSAARAAAPDTLGGDEAIGARPTHEEGARPRPRRRGARADRADPRGGRGRGPHEPRRSGPLHAGEAGPRRGARSRA